MQTLSVPERGGVIPSSFLSAEVAEVYRVFLLTFFAVDHFMPANIREYSLNEITAKRTVNVSHRKADNFSF